MTIIRLSNGGSLLEQRYSFPDPDIVIRIVFRYDDIKYLKPRSASEVASIVYFYDDRDYLNNLIHYTGETNNTPLTRYKSTHCKAAWLQTIKYPLIGMAESSSQPWDMETRKTIESLCAYRMKELGFKVANSQTVNWANGVTIPSNVNGAYADSVAKIITEFQVAMLGLSGTNIFEIGKNIGAYEPEKVVTEEVSGPEETMFSVKNPLRLKSEEKFDILIKAEKIREGEPLHIVHRLVNKSVILRSCSTVEYRDAQYTPRDALKAIAHEVFTNGITSKHSEGWSGYNPFTCYAVERNNELIKLETLWNQVQHRVIGFIEDSPEQVVDEEWYNLVMSEGLVGATLYCNNKAATVGDQAEILYENKTFLSLTEFGEHVDGLDSTGFGNFRILHKGELYDIKSN